MKTVSELLQWVVYSGGGIIVASWALERIKRFQAATAENKRLIAMASSVAVSLAGYAILTYVPAATLALINPWLTVAAGTVVLYSGGQIVHQATKNKLP